MPETARSRRYYNNVTQRRPIRSELRGPPGRSVPGPLRFLTPASPLDAQSRGYGSLPKSSPVHNRQLEKGMAVSFMLVLGSCTSKRAYSGSRFHVRWVIGPSAAEVGPSADPSSMRR